MYVAGPGTALKSSPMWVVSTVVEVASLWRTTWNWVPVSGFIRAVSMTVALSGAIERIGSVFVSGATACVM